MCVINTCSSVDACTLDCTNAGADPGFQGGWGGGGGGSLITISLEGLAPFVICPSPFLKTIPLAINLATTSYTIELVYTIQI